VLKKDIAYKDLPFSIKRTVDELDSLKLKDLNEKCFYTYKCDCNYKSVNFIPNLSEGYGILETCEDVYKTNRNDLTRFFLVDRNNIYQIDIEKNSENDLLTIEEIKNKYKFYSYKKIKK